MEKIPENFTELIQELKLTKDRNERFQILVSLAEKYKECVPEGITKPYRELDKVPGCESEVYMWGIPQSDGTLKFCFAVENPQGISTMLVAYLIDCYLSNIPPEHIINLPSGLINDIFGEDLSMGKELGFKMMIEKVKLLAKSHLKEKDSEP